MENAYRNWYLTQIDNDESENFLVQDERLRAQRRPGMTSITSLEQEHLGSVNSPINTSNGAGAVMRSAPFGLAYYKNPDFAYDIAIKSAALTHGNPQGYLPAGALAYLIAKIIQGNDIEQALFATVEKLKNTSSEALELAQ
ncbi:ADP-ribosylglycohydrolase family protein, partial [bacterium]|nr:ADP-ribosylglycohydrolase family protein [bacterium]